MIFTEKLESNLDTKIHFQIPLSAEERTRTQQRIELDGKVIFLRLKRGIILTHGDLLRSETGDIIVGIIAKYERVITVKSDSYLALMKAAYHLGNRHIPLEITTNYLRLYPDSVLESMLQQMGLDVQEEIVPFFPELGAYQHHH